ncbi:MAG: hypothetical protein LBS60_06250 [Deltaproteobacteria bacterium]|jgi:hypothetical protein|nr:hypothetical protein [Deltaproteobacteria bacterium]
MEKSDNSGIKIIDSKSLDRAYQYNDFTAKNLLLSNIEGQSPIILGLPPLDAFAECVIRNEPTEKIKKPRLTVRLDSLIKLELPPGKEPPPGFDPLAINLLITEYEDDYDINTFLKHFSYVNNVAATYCTSFDVILNIKLVVILGPDVKKPPINEINLGCCSFKTYFILLSHTDKDQLIELLSNKLQSGEKATRFDLLNLAYVIKNNISDVQFLIECIKLGSNPDLSDRSLAGDYQILLSHLYYKELTPEIIKRIKEETNMGSWLEEQTSQAFEEGKRAAKLEAKQEALTQLAIDSLNRGMSRSDVMKYFGVSATWLRNVEESMRSETKSEKPSDTTN